MKLIASFAVLLSILVKSAYTFSINGVHAGVDNSTGERPFRLEINQFKTSGAAWDLYILSLSQFMAVDQSEKHSYFKIAGIHGVPADTPWDGVVGTAGGTGYCEHGSVLFPIWHRPYVALFEEKIWDFAQEIALQYPEPQQDVYKAAAIRLRVPYWDWSLNGLPDVLQTTTITINTPQGQQTIDNPLYAYKFNPLNATQLPYFSQYPTTVREPNPETLSSQNDIVAANLANTASYWHDQTYLLLTSIDKWTPFSNVNGGSDLNLEIIHGGIHDYLGGLVNQGHMTYLWYSAFDPVFWLHHAQVDRLVALWQAIHPFEYVEPGATSVTTYYVPQGRIQDQYYPLVPFRKNAKGQFHTAHSARRLKAFGYSYPELVYWSERGSNVWTLQQDVIATVNSLYLPAASVTSLLATPNITEVVGIALKASWSWKISLKTSRDEISAPIVLAFFTDTDASTADSIATAVQQKLIGQALIIHPGNVSDFSFARGPTSVPLTSTLLPHNDLIPATVVAWVNDKVTYRILDYNTFRQSRTNFPTSTIAEPTLPIEVVLLGRQVTQPIDEFSLPQYGPWKDYGTASLTGKGGTIAFKNE